MAHYRLSDRLPSAIVTVDGSEKKIYEGNTIYLNKGDNFEFRFFNPLQEKIGVEILKKALQAPIRQIAQNAGKDGSVIAAEVLKKEGTFGYNAAADVYDDMIKAGIVDPTKVVRSALENAVSAASMLLTTECVVAEKPEEKKEKPAMPPMPGGY